MAFLVVNNDKAIKHFFHKTFNLQESYTVPEYEFPTVFQPKEGTPETMTPEILKDYTKRFLEQTKTGNLEKTQKITQELNNKGILTDVLLFLLSENYIIGTTGEYFMSSKKPIVRAIHIIYPKQEDRERFLNYIREKALELYGDEQENIDRVIDELKNYKLE